MSAFPTLRLLLTKANIARVHRLWCHRDRAAISELQSRIARWIEDHRSAIISNLPVAAFPPGLDDRQQDSWEPLIAIADVAGG